MHPQPERALLRRVKPPCLRWPRFFPGTQIGPLSLRGWMCGPPVCFRPPVYVPVMRKLSPSTMGCDSGQSPPQTYVGCIAVNLQGMVRPWLGRTRTHPSKCGRPPWVQAAYEGDWPIRSQRRGMPGVRAGVVPDDGVKASGAPSSILPLGGGEPRPPTPRGNCVHPRSHPGCSRRHHGAGQAHGGNTARVVPLARAAALTKELHNTC